MPRLRTLSAFTLALALAASAALAKPRQEAIPARYIPVASVAAETLFGRLLSWLDVVWTKIGCGIDPDGHCTGGSGTTVPSPEVDGDAGCVIDPNGACSQGQ